MTLREMKKSLRYLLVKNCFAKKVYMEIHCIRNEARRLTSRVGVVV
jgi:hypothetical protein